ncbi:MAG: DUF1559 domain-containing protein [Pirellulaceae bacterium]
MRQILIAVHNYESSSRMLPPASSNGYSFLADVLPFLDQAQYIDFNIPAFATTTSLKNSKISSLICPSDGTACRGMQNFTSAGTTNYAGNLGYNQANLGFNGGLSPATSPSPLLSVGPIGFGDMTDGTSNTALIAEILVGDGQLSDRRTNWFLTSSFTKDEFDLFVSSCNNRQFALFNGAPTGDAGSRGRPWLIGNDGSTLYTHVNKPNGLSCICNGAFMSAFTAASNHPGGVMVGFADGHADFVSEAVDLEVWRSQGTRSGQEAN